MTETANLPAEEDKSPAAQQRKRLDAFMGELEKRNAQLTTLLSDSNVDPKKFLEVARRAFMRNPDLLKCDAASLIESFINAANDGLLPDGRQGAVVPYNVNVAPKNRPKNYVKKAQWIPMYQGLLDVAYRSGNFRSIEARVVYAGDVFDYELGIEPTVTHKPMRRPAGTSPEIVAAYAVAITREGGKYFEPFEGNDIAKVKAASRASSGPWGQWGEEMTRKGPLRRMWKYLPKDDRMARVGAREDEVYDLDLEDYQEVPAPARQIKAGFAALPQGADPTMEMQVPIQDAESEPVEVVQEAEEEERHAAEPPAEEEPHEAAESLNEPKEDPAEEAFRLNLTSAKSWLNIKQALRTLAKTRSIAQPDRRMAWMVFDQLRTSGAEKTDILNDVVLFECWLESGPSADEIDGNLRIMEKDPAFSKLPPSDQDRIRRRAAAIKDV